MKLKHMLMCAVLCAGLSVVMGAIASHALKAILSAKELAWISTAAQYQMYHSLALISVVLLMVKLGKQRYLMMAGFSFLAGIVMFSGSLYLLALSGARWLVYLTPLGGFAFIAGWLMMLLGVFKLSFSDDG